MTKYINEKKLIKKKKLIKNNNMLKNKRKKKILKWKHLNISEKNQIIDIIKEELKPEIFNYIDNKILQHLGLNKLYKLNFQEKKLENQETNIIETTPLMPKLLSTILPEINSNYESISVEPEPKPENDLNSEKQVIKDIENFENKLVINSIEEEQPLLPRYLTDNSNDDSDIFYDTNPLYWEDNKNNYKRLPTNESLQEPEKFFDIEAQRSYTYSENEQEDMTESIIYDNTIIDENDDFVIQEIEESNNINENLLNLDQISKNEEENHHFRQ